MRAKRSKNIEKSLKEANAVIGQYEANKTCTIEELAKSAEVEPYRAALIIGAHKQQNEALCSNEGAWAAFTLVACLASFFIGCFLLAFCFIHLADYLLG